MDTPCRYCNRRTANCHSWCEQYQLYAESMEEVRKALRQDSINRGHSPGKDKAIKIVSFLKQQGRYR